MLFQVELRLKNLWLFIWIQPIFFFKNSFVLWLNNTKHSFKVVTQLALLSTVSKRSIHFADSFLLLKWSFKIEATEPWDMPMASMISGTFNLRPTNNIWIFQMFQVYWAQLDLHNVQFYTCLCDSATKFNKSLFYQWNWWYSVPILFRDIP